ncbi:MAG TPA: type II toxin-antitoxin system RelE/ParE family toxin [Pseudacidobacterium sp.]|nr:type II toxin-antitoxin system RelE/ParE family toxin [Pseudacidobacterium sp.]
MPEVRLSKRALRDFKSISHYTLETWGEAQAFRYVEDLELFLNQLAQRPMLGRLCTDIASGLRRFEHGKHIIFYRPRRDGIFVVRILHRKMDPQKHISE